jgi:hypothetical protein
VARRWHAVKKRPSFMSGRKLFAEFDRSLTLTLKRADKYSLGGKLLYHKLKP